MVGYKTAFDQPETVALLDFAFQKQSIFTTCWLRRRYWPPPHAPSEALRVARSPLQLIPARTAPEMAGNTGHLDPDSEF